MINKQKFAVLGIHYGGHDTSSVLMIDGVIVAACEQERYDLQKHSRAFPIDAARDCLKIGGLDWDDIDEIAFGADFIELIRKAYLEPALADNARIGFLIEDIERIKTYYRQEDIVREHTGFKGDIKFYKHHLCHIASAYYPSDFDEALLVSFDGTGETGTGMLGRGRDGKIDILHDKTLYPHSFGLLYSAITYFLGWRHHCDEGIIMGLASFGNAEEKIPGDDRTYIDVFRDIIVPTGPFDYKINLDWIAYHLARDVWVSDQFKFVFGEVREYDGPITAHHKNIAAALQQRLEEVVLDQLAWARQEYGLDKLCISGGVGLNCSLNGKIAASGIFSKIFVQPASGDAGVPIGAVYLADINRNGPPARQKHHDFYLGSRFENEEIKMVLDERGFAYDQPDDFFLQVAKALEDGLIIGWFQGGAEFGPRALGNRSILCRPYPAAMRDHLNARVKFREEFRPFAPAVLAEHRTEYFQIDQDSPHMLIACQVQPDKREAIAATVHTDDTCRVQTVSEENNPRFRRLISEFNELTNCPVVLNTSFNVKGQPIVNTPVQALDCFLSTNIDVLAIGDFILRK